MNDNGTTIIQVSHDERVAAFGRRLIEARRRLDQLRQEAREYAVMPTRQPRIFVADDQRDVVESLRLLLKGEGYAAETFGSTESLVGALRERTADAVLMDLNYTRDTTSGDEGLDAVDEDPLVRRAHANCRHDGVGHASTSPSKAMRRGAQDFVEKPWDNERLLSGAAHAESRSAARCNARARSRPRTAQLKARRTIR